jgi:hypothetical protein
MFPSTQGTAEFLQSGGCVRAAELTPTPFCYSKNPIRSLEIKQLCSIGIADREGWLLILNLRVLCLERWDSGLTFWLSLVSGTTHLWNALIVTYHCRKKWASNPSSYTTEPSAWLVHKCLTLYCKPCSKCVPRRAQIHRLLAFGRKIVHMNIYQRIPFANSQGQYLL